MELESIATQAKVWLLSVGLRILVVVIVALLALKLSRFVATRIISGFMKVKTDEEVEKRARTLEPLMRYTLRTAILIIALIMILGELGIEIGPILAAAGVVGLAVGFGAQRLVQDIISGFFILMEDQYRVGDVIQTAGKSGTVEKVNLRMTVLREYNGNVHFIRNGSIDIVTNTTREFSCFILDVGVAYKEDIDEVISIIKEIDEELRADPEYRELIVKPIEVWGVDQFADSAVVIRSRITTKPGKQWGTGREFRRRLKKRFDERHIEIPFPHVTLYIGDEKIKQALTER
jgi:small conductance mechanosensitive channel